MRRYVMMIIAVVAALGSIHPAANAITMPAGPPPTVQSSQAGSAEIDAMRQAHETGQPVEIPEQTTETTQVMANPNGTFTMRTNQHAVRVKRDGVWRGIDTTLTHRPDDAVTPVATALDVTFSGGGTASLVTLRQAGKALAFTWPRPLPTPTIAADTATYPGVFPGVDLKITARSDSYSQVLVVHDAIAAANPALANIRLTATGTGLNLTVRADGGLAATDANGAEVLTGPAPVMWDSHHDEQSGQPPTATDQGSGRVTRLTVTSTPRATGGNATANSVTDLTLRPDTTALTGPDVTYPVYIDPSMIVGKQHWLRITDNGWNPHYDDSNAIAQVGYCDRWDDCGSDAWRARSFFEMDSRPLLPRNGVTAKIWRAEFFAMQVWSADHDCNAAGQPTQVWQSDTIRPDTRWAGPISLHLDTQHSNGGGPCPAGNLRFDVRTAAGNAAGGGWPYVTFGLVAANENDRMQWKKFTNDPRFEVDFSFPPNNATGLHVSNEVKCTGQVITPDANPTLYATATDNNNPPLQLGQWHHVWTADESRTIPSQSGIIIASGTVGQWRVPDRLTDGDWKFRVFTKNVAPEGPGHDLFNPANGGFSSWYPFTVRATPPAAAPKIESTIDYPANYWGAPNGAPGAIAVNANGASHIVGYTYTFTGSGTEVVPNTNDCDYARTFGTSGGWIPKSEVGTDWIPIPAGLSPGFHTMHVRSFDDAHNLSPEISHTFYIPPNTGLGSQRFEAEALPRSQPAGQNLAIGPFANCCNVSWSGGSQLLFQGNATGQSFTLTFNAAAESDYQIKIGLTKSVIYGQVSFKLDGQPIGQPCPSCPVGSFDAYNPTAVNAHHPLGIRHLTRGSHTLTVTTTGTNPRTVGARYWVGLDYVELTQTTRYEGEDSAQIVASQPAGQNIHLAPQTNCCASASWSQNAQLVFRSNRPDTLFELNFRVPIEADYALGARLTKANDYGKLTFLLDDKPLRNTDTSPWDGYNPSVISEYLPFGGAHLTAGQHKLTVKVIGTNPASVNERYLAGVDFVTAVPVNNVTASSFTSAMNNDGIATDGTAADLDLGGASLSAQTLAAAGYAPGSTATVNGATFTLPAARADGSDNVIAIGQTIPFPTTQQVKATAVGLLVISTCGAAPARSGTITYTDNTTQNYTFPQVEDWVGMHPDLASFVLPYRNEGTTAHHGVRPRVLALFVPADPTRTLKSITLPNYGTSLLPGSCSPALHVLAMAPRPVAAPWVGTWAAPADTARPAPNSGLADKTVRTVIHPTVTGGSVRVRLENPQTNAPVTIDSASLAAQAGTGAGTLAAPARLTFGGSAQVTLPAGGEALSDPVAYPGTGGGSGNLVVSVHLPRAVVLAPIHAGPNAPVYLGNGDITADTTGTPFTVSLGGSRYVSGVDVSTSDGSHGTVAVLGDQLTAIAPPGDGYRPTWVDNLPAKLGAGGLSVPGGLVNASMGGLPANGRWRLDDGGGSTARDSAGSAPATVTGGVTWSGDRGGSVILNGSNGCLITGGPVVGTGTGSYSVSAWVKLNATGPGPQTVVSQDASQNNAFAVQYTGSADNKWAFALPVSNTNGAAVARVLSAATVQTGVWTHLIGTYDTATRIATLYVNGQYQGWVSQPTPFSSSGPLAIGRGKTNGNPTAFLNGSVSDVRVYERAANGYDAPILAGPDPGSGPQPGLGAPTASDADRTLDRTVLNQPRLRTVIVALGANDILAAKSKEAIEHELTELMHDRSPTGLRNGRRTDGTTVHVILATVPPLGLADTDWREQQRRQLNADILAHYTDYGADGRVDFASAVRDPVHSHQINPVYLTNGVPNAAYHEAIAQAIADAAGRFPPEAEL